MKINLSGRAAIITGGSKGIGFAVAARHDWTQTAHAHLPGYEALREAAHA